MTIGNYQQDLKAQGIDYALNEVDSGMQVIASINDEVVIQTFSESGDLV